MDTRFTTGTCKALLSAIGIWVDSKSILIDEVVDSESNLRICTTVNDANTEIAATLLVDMSGPIGDVLRKPATRHRDHVIGMQTCRSVDKDLSR